MLAALASAPAICAPQTVAASTFPATESLDSFERAAENPLSAGGKWSKLAWTKTIGRVFSEKYGWVPKEGGSGAPETEADGAYWHPYEFSSPAVSTHVYAENLHDYVALWCDTTGTGSKNGYRLRVVGLAKTNYAFKLVLEKWVNGTSTLLGESPEVLFKGLSSENVVGITAGSGKISAWYGTAEVGLAVKVEASDSTFSHGYVGIEGTNKAAYGETQFRASSPLFPTTESVDTFERTAENPLSDGGKWSKLAWTKTIGRVYGEGFGWLPKEGGLEAPESEADGAYWNAREFSGAAVSVRIFAENRHDYVGIWCDTTGVGSKNGYRVKVPGSSTKGNYAFKLILEKWVNGSRTLLGESPEILFKGNSYENLVGITAIGGKIKAWYGTTEAALAAKVEASDATFGHGYVGIEGTDQSAYGETLYRASQNESLPPSNNESPKITGPATYGQLENATVGTWTGTAPITYAYQWERCEGSSCTAIAGATESSYRPASADVGKTLRIKVTATNAIGSSSALSEASPVVTGPPSNTAIPAIAGPATYYHFEEALPGVWTGTPPISFAYQWELCTASGCIPIPDATKYYYFINNREEVGKALRIRVTASNAYGSSTAFSYTSAVIVDDPCLPSQHHCYATAYQYGVSTAGLNVEIETSYAGVPYWKEDFVSNEAWSGFQPGVSWVEGGAASGGATPGYVYFTATRYEDGRYYENKFENGPGGNNYFPVDEHYVANNIWYITAGNDLVGYAGEPTTASRATAGLEETNDNITNWGHLRNLSWWDPITGVKHEGWSPEAMSITPESPRVTCISLQGSTEAYFVANGNPCTLGAAIPSNPPAGSNLANAPVTSSPLTSTLALLAGQRFATQYGGGEAPKSIHVYSATQATAMQAVQPEATIPPGTSSAAMLSDRVYVDVMTGDFTLPYSPVPPGAKAPSGQNLAVIFSATTGHVLNIALTPSRPNVATLGTAVASIG